MAQSFQCNPPRPARRQLLVPPERKSYRNIALAAALRLLYHASTPFANPLLQRGGGH